MSSATQIRKDLHRSTAILADTDPGTPEHRALTEKIERDVDALIAAENGRCTPGPISRLWDALAAPFREVIWRIARVITRISGSTPRRGA